MTFITTVPLTTDLVLRAAQHIATQMKNSGAEAAALCTLDGQCAWASDPAFARAAPNIARIGVASLRLWARSRTGRLEQVGLVTDDGMVDLVFVPPLASLLVVSKRNNEGWPAGEPSMLLQAIGLK